jgi:GNAT superfamily N-acetyltransferase
MTPVTIRPALEHESKTLTELCIRSKAHWGYDAAFMKASAAALEISPAAIRMGRVCVAVNERQWVVGVASVEPLANVGEFDLAHFFIEPRAMGTGVGRALFAAIVAAVKAEGASRLMILSDPNAAPFYQRMGAVLLGDAPSDAIPGRRLPLLVYRIQEANGG